jgi:hypothetical protein
LVNQCWVPLQQPLTNTQKIVSLFDYWSRITANCTESLVQISGDNPTIHLTYNTISCCFDPWVSLSARCYVNHTHNRPMHVPCHVFDRLPMVIENLNFVSYIADWIIYVHMFCWMGVVYEYFNWHSELMSYLSKNSSVGIAYIIK